MEEPPVAFEVSVRAKAIEFIQHVIEMTTVAGSGKSLGGADAGG
jgi:hypothetical protein